MTGQIIDGKQIAQRQRQRIKLEVEQRIEEGKQRPGLAVIIVGANSASQLYVRNKHIACNEVGIYSQLHEMAADVSEQHLLDRIDQLNTSGVIHGILVQLPLPGHINTNLVLDTINPIKDVDGFHPFNVGLLLQRRPNLRCCTPKGIVTMLQQSVGDLAGMQATIIGASNIVGRPLSLELLMQKCTTTVCHRHTKDLTAITRQSDLIVCAAGSPGILTADMVKPGAIVVDVGINRLPDGSLCGDVDFDKVKEVASWISPVPGGVGPMTVASLLDNTLQAAKLQDG